ncbi:MAG: response regulator [Lachnospiraceae bacterium]
MYKVLLVDDEPGILEAEKRAIEQKTTHFEVIGESYTVNQAIEMVDSLHPDVVITDMKMPKRTGIELIKYISELENETIICIAVSGYQDFTYVHDAFVYGAFDYLLKPVEPRKLAELFSRIYRLLVSTQKENTGLKLPPPKLTSQKLVEEIEHHIKENISEDHSIIRICGKFHISQPYLSKIFKKHKNCTYNEYLIQLKIKEAKRLISNEDVYLIGEIAEALGFSDQFYFSKVFKNIVGVTPREYKNKTLHQESE